MSGTQSAVTPLRVANSEWIKFRSLRSTTVTLLVAVSLVITFGLIAASLGTDGAGRGAAVDTSLVGTQIAQLAFGVLGVLFAAGEYGAGTIRTTLTAVPRRLPVLWAKLAVFTAVAFPAGLLAAGVAFTAGQAVLGADGVSWTEPGVVRAVLGCAVYLTGSGLLGLALGALLRSTAAAVSLYCAVMFLLDGLSVMLFPASWEENVSRYLPSEAGAAIGSVVTGADELGPATALAVFAGYLAVLVTAAAWRLRRGDA
jgi:ABC-type transport system involved in multi-copper enzyme maturation permease subunit